MAGVMERALMSADEAGQAQIQMPPPEGAGAMVGGQGAPQGAPQPGMSGQGGNPTPPPIQKKAAMGDPEDPASRLASVASLLITTLDDKSGGNMPDAVIIPAAQEALALIAELAIPSFAGAPDAPDVPTGTPTSSNPTSAQQPSEPAGDKSAPSSTGATEQEKDAYRRTILAVQQGLYDDKLGPEIMKMVGDVPDDPAIVQRAMVILEAQMADHYGVSREGVEGLLQSEDPQAIQGYLAQMNALGGM